MSSTNDVVTPSEHLTGRVKWFNNSTGYGFITITESGSDIFVHHSAIQVENQQYKYLVQGEYVELDLVKSTSGPHEFQASNVSGIKGGKLMCETRREFKLARTNYKSSEQEQEQEPREKRVPRVRGEGPREAPRERVPRERAPREAPRKTESTEEKKEWTLVDSKRAPGKSRGRPARTTSEAK